ncbi:type VI secretion system tube protein TssD [Klebsiella pneumoniae]|nr:type VI secretion system tube protein TssD [Klebsiella pneumoniae]MDZ5871882.1 type VI secretion system tube protein TssD [Klebsiella pneumoniae]MDZ5879231.1 type VI secretion system tube protein TssD [Klebsiella pneumoniae]MDZ5951038.1 type VI secretion system tube protein TssD [Klebsiella pneumoniae]MDZ5988650.1 type VI secretion system tube protein TssD [Klebsiella pneumoniae]
MSNPAYLWLTDENDSPIIGSCLMPTRTGSIELRAVNHHVWLPTDNNTGKLTGTRLHTPVKIQKEFDRTTPLLFRALCEGRTLRSATLKMYRINEAGLEVEYFNIAMANIKITAITPNLHPAGMISTHLEDIDFRYETITWIYTEGNIMYRDSWNDRCCAW